MILVVLGFARMVSIFAFPTLENNREAPIPDAMLAGGIAIVGLALVVASSKKEE
jgi:hypothetical protein